MTRDEFQAIAQNNPADALMILWDACEAAEINLASILGAEVTDDVTA